ncbi:hypothetical protein ACRRTK_016827 [Alexandromys fortis]
MSVSALSPTTFPGSISGFLQVASVLSLLLLLFKVIQFYVYRQWLLRATQQFPSPPANWFFGHKDKWEQIVGQDSTLEIFQHISLMTLDTIMKCAFSHEGSVQLDGKYQPYIQAVGDMINLFFFRVRNIFHQNDIIYSLSSNGRQATSAYRLAHDHTDQVIKSRKAQLQDEGELEKVKKKRRLDFLDILLFARMENGGSLSDKDLRAEVDTFMFEGHDTTASGISWILYALATHPEHQQRCRDEVQSLLGGGASITWNCIGKQFAMNELKVAVALTLLRFELLPDPTRIPVPILRIVLKSKNGIHLCLKKLQ